MTIHEAHPVAAIFPEMSNAEFEALKADIDAHGLLEPVWLHPDGRILDGRNRHRACCELGMVPKYRTYRGDLDMPALVQFVISMNLNRRHLDSGQRAFVALEVERVLAEAARERMIAAQNNNAGRAAFEKFQKLDEVPIHAAAQAAKIVGTNQHYVVDAKRIQEQAPDLAQAVRQGEMKMAEARRQLKNRMPEPEPKPEPVKPVQEMMEITEPWLGPIKIGNVLIACEDSRNLDGLVEHGSVDLVITSPPYNVGVEYGAYQDSASDKEYFDMLYWVFENCWSAMKNGGRIAVVVPFGVGRDPWIPLASRVMETIERAGFSLRGQIIWDKGTSGNRTTWGSWRSPSNPSLRDTCEAVIVAHKNTGDADVPSSVLVQDSAGSISPWLDTDLFMELAQDHWAIAPESAQRVKHPAPFPVALAERLIKFYGWPGCRILDPFSGSGTVGVAATKLQCEATLIDIDANYCWLAHDRISRALVGA